MTSTSMIHRAAAWLGLRQDMPAEDTTTPARLLPPSRTATASLAQSVAVPSVFRAVQIIHTSATQLSIDGERGGQVITDGKESALIRRPSSNMTRSQWLGEIIMAFATNGNAYLKVTKEPLTGEVLDLEPIPPAEVWTSRNTKTGDIQHTWRGVDYTPRQMMHLYMLRLPGHLRGLNPIEAARAGITQQIGLQDHLGQWWNGGGQPTGLLRSDQPLTNEQARGYQRAWNGQDPVTGEPLPRDANPTGVKVLGHGLDYNPMLLKPSDAMWLDQQRYTSLDIARLYGVPSSLMLVAPEGGSRTYSNVEQEWIAFTRFTLMGYLRPIEEALTDAIPRGQTARFNLETLLRGDTESRYKAHKIATGGAAWASPEEIRAIENMPPGAPKPAPIAPAKEPAA